MIKLMKRLILAAIILPIVAVIALFYYIDAIAKSGVEHGATYALGVPTTLDDISVGVFTGRLELSDLSVANPPGFRDEPFLKLGNGRVAVTLGSLMEDLVELPELTLSGIQMNLEKKSGSSNYETILKGLDKFESGEKPAPDASDEPGKKFIVRLIAVEDINVSVDFLSLTGNLSRIPLHIEKIELRDVGTDSDQGVLLSQLSDILIKAILEAVVEQGGSAIPNAIALELSSGLASLEGLNDVSMAVIGDVTTQVNGEVRKVSELGGQILDGVGKTIDGLGGLGELGKDSDEVGKGLGDGVNKISEGLGGLLGGDKPDKKDEK